MTRAKIGAGRALSRTSADRIKKYVDAMGAYFCKAGDLVLLGIYAADEEGLTIMQIVEALGLLQPTVSMSVSALVEDGMVERRGARPRACRQHHQARRQAQGQGINA